MATLILDIGHANGTGARGYGYEEHDLSSIIGKKLKKRIEKHGHKVTLLDFPTLSNKEDLRRTISTANATKGVTFGISLHMDAATNKKAKGGHVIYTSAKGKQIAEAIADFLCSLMPGRAEAIVDRDNLGILNQTRAPWVLIELGFITNLDDIKKLVDNPDTALDELKPLLDALEKGILAGIERAKEWNTKTA